MNVDDAPADEDLRSLLAGTQVIAVVGFSSNPDRPSNQIAWYLRHQGYTVYGVNPRLAGTEVDGIPVVPTLADVPDPVDVVDVFRRAEHTPDIAREAVAAGARALWLQLGITNAEAKSVARDGELVYVQDRCMKIEHARLIGSASGHAG